MGERLAAHQFMRNARLLVTVPTSRLVATKTASLVKRSSLRGFYHTIKNSLVFANSSRLLHAVERTCQMLEDVPEYMRLLSFGQAPDANLAQLATAGPPKKLKSYGPYIKLINWIQNEPLDREQNLHSPLVRRALGAVCEPRTVERTATLLKQLDDPNTTDLGVSVRDEKDIIIETLQLQVEELQRRVPREAPVAVPAPTPAPAVTAAAPPSSEHEDMQWTAQTAVELQRLTDLVDGMEKAIGISTETPPAPLDLARSLQLATSSKPVKTTAPDNLETLKRLNSRLELFHKAQLEREQGIVKPASEDAALANMELQELEEALNQSEKQNADLRTRLASLEDQQRPKGGV